MNCSLRESIIRIWLASPIGLILPYCCSYYLSNDIGLRYQIMNKVFGLQAVFLLLGVFNVWCLGLKLRKRIHLHFCFQLDFSNSWKPVCLQHFQLLVSPVPSRRKNNSGVKKTLKTYLNGYFWCTSKEKAVDGTSTRSTPSSSCGISKKPTLLLRMFFFTFQKRTFSIKCFFYLAAYAA